MNNQPSLVKLGRALLFVALCAAAGSASATPTRGAQLDSYCAKQPMQAAAPQQSRPYAASGSSCALCHIPPGTTANNLNTLGSANAACSGSGTATTCPATVNPFCVAHAPSGASITAPAAGTSVAQGQSLTFSAANATNPDGFPLTYTWLFSGGMPSVTGQSVAVAMTVIGSITSTLQVRNSVGMLASGTPPTRTVTVTGATANQPPVATINAPTGNVTVAQGGTVTFMGSGTDPDNNLPLTYNWNFGGGAANSTAQNPGAVQFNTVGVFTVTFTVTDSQGLTSAPVTRTVTVTGSPQPLVASIAAPAINVSLLPGGAVIFRGMGSGLGNQQLSYRWTFPGGSPSSSTQQNPGAVRYGMPGSYVATLTVTNRRRDVTARATRKIFVAAANRVVGIDPNECMSNDDRYDSHDRHDSQHED
ncbi:MAG TPA: PKD domain-containing protein [Gallionella sp.]|nr:PKD domain-containing protein [Gallionella sp.]